MSQAASATSNACLRCAHRTQRSFCNLSETTLKRFNALGVTLRLAKGDVLFRENEPCNSVTVLCEGQVKLSCMSRDGRVLIIKIAGGGDVLGLSAAMLGLAYEATAEVLSPTIARCILKETFLEFLCAYGDASLHAAQKLSEEYRSAFFEARRLGLAPSAAGRLASVLLDLGKTASLQGAEMRFTMSLTHEELANLAGISRETVTRLLGKLQENNLIRIRGSAFTILSPEELNQLAL